jgi:DNA-binding HxlR family transcriptional regulator
MSRDIAQVRAFRSSSDACPIPAAIELIGERWTCLILRATMLGLCHFEEFQACLGIARNILSDRLGRLVDSGILARTADPSDRRKVIYSLTERGAGLLPVLVALRQWGVEQGLGKPSHPTLADRRDRRPVNRLAVQAHDGRLLELEDLIWVGPDGEELGMPISSQRSGGRLAA